MQTLLLRAYKNWDFPKGMVEPGEQPFDAAVREVREETTLENLAFDWGKNFVRHRAPITRARFPATTLRAARIPRCSCRSIRNSAFPSTTRRAG